MNQKRSCLDSYTNRDRLLLQPNIETKNRSGTYPAQLKQSGEEEMRFLLGVLLGYSMRGKKKPLITVLTALAFIVYVIIPAIALLALRLDVQHERQMRPTQIQVPALKGLSYEDAESKLHASNLNIRVLATRSAVCPEIRRK